MDTKAQGRFKLIKALCRRAIAERPFTFLTLRHVVASLLVDKKGISRISIGDLLGHMDLATTKIYLHSLSEAAAGAAAAPEALEGEFSLVTGIGDGFEPKRPLVTGPGGKDREKKLLK